MIKGSFPMSKVLVFEGNSYVCWKKDIRLFYDCMVKNVIKGSFPIKVLVFEGNSYVCWKNEDIRLFYDCMVKNVIKGSFPMSKVLVFEGIRLFYATYVEKMKILDYFMIAHGKECD